MKPILTIIAVLFCTSVAFSQDSTKKKMQIIKNEAVVKLNPDTLHITLPTTAKFLKIGDRVYSMDNLMNSVPLFVTLDWVIGNYNYIQTSKNPEFTGSQLEQLKIPLMPYVNAWYQVQQKKQ